MKTKMGILILLLLVIPVTVYAGTMTDQDKFQNVGFVQPCDGTEYSEVDPDGNTMVEPDGCLYFYGDTGQPQIVTGSGVLVAFNVYGSTAGDIAYLEDATASSSLTICSVAVGANTSTNSFTPPRGINFSNGLYLKATDSDVKVTVAYDDSQ